MFRLINLRSIKDNLFIVIFVLLGCVVSTSLLAATIFILDDIDNYVNSSSRLLNHGDISITQDNLWFGDSVYKENNRELDNYLHGCTDIDYTFEQILMPDSSAKLWSNSNNIILGSSYWYRFVDFKDMSRYADCVSTDIAKETVIISESMAKRLSAEVGDKLNIEFNINTPILSMPISAIIPDNEINIKRAYLGYIMIDLSDYKQWLSNNVGINPEQDFENSWIKRYYIDSGNAILLQEIEKKAINIYGENLKIVYADDLPAQARVYFGFLIVFLSCFTIVCFIFSSIGLFNLCHIRILNRQNDIAILKIYGLSNTRNIMYILLEMIVLVLPAYVVGISIGYGIFQLILFHTSILGSNSLSAKTIFFAIGKIICLNLISVLLICIPVVVYGDKRKITDVLRDNSSGYYLKRSVFMSMCCSSILILMLFDITLNSQELNNILSKIFIIAIGILFLVVCVKKLLLIFKIKSYFRMGLNFICKDKIRVPLTIMTYAFCFCMVYLLILANYSLNALASDASIGKFDYNVEVEVTNQGQDRFVDYINNQININHYYVVNAYAIDYEDMHVEFDVYDFNNYEGIMSQKIGRKAVVSSYIKSQCKIREDDVINISLRQDSDLLSFSVCPEDYIAPFPGGPRVAIAVSKDAVSDLPKEADVNAYFFHINGVEEKSLRNYAKETGEIRVISTEDIVESKLSEIMDYRYMFKLMTIYFFVSTLTVTLSSSIVTYINRQKEFYIYYYLGASKKKIRNIIYYENIVIILIGILFGIIISNFSLEYVSTILELELYSDYRLFTVLLFLFLTMPFIITKLVIKMFFSRSAGELLRDD